MNRLRYTLSLGSNVQPEANMGAMLDALTTLSQRLWLSRIIRTDPVGMLSDHPFLNTAVCLDTTLAPEQLKQVLCQIEINLGRDRHDPLSKVKDRPADLDIVGFCRPDEALATAVLPSEPYVRPLVIEIWQAQGQLLHLPAPPLPPGVPLVWRGREVGCVPLFLQVEGSVTDWSPATAVGTQLAS